MKNYRCLIIEDEPIAAEVLKDYVLQVPFLQLVKTCSDAIFALEILQKEHIDLVFLDIHLPKLKGLDFLKTLKAQPMVIITTAFQEYALQGYEHNVTDYLLKPVEFSRFLTAVNKLAQRTIMTEAPVRMAASADREHLFFNTNKKLVKVYVDEILYAESLREYVKIHTREKWVLTKMQLGELEQLLGTEHFLRVHRSFLVARNKIDAYSPGEMEVNKKQLPIGRHYRELVMMKMSNGQDS